MSLEKIKLIEITAEGREYPMNFAMLVAHLRQTPGRAIIQVGQWRLDVRLLGDTSEPLEAQLGARHE